MKSVFSTVVRTCLQQLKGTPPRHRAASSAGRFGTRGALNCTGRTRAKCSAPNGGGQLAKKSRPERSSPKAPRATLLGFPWKPANVYLPQHNAPVAMHTQWHQGGIAYGTNVREYLANTWFLCSECAFHTGMGFRETLQYSEERVDKGPQEYDSDLLGRMCFPHVIRNESLCNR